MACNFICDACGTTEPGDIDFIDGTWGRPYGWFQKFYDSEFYHYCSRSCLKEADIERDDRDD